MRITVYITCRASGNVASPGGKGAASQRLSSIGYDIAVRRSCDTVAFENSCKTAVSTSCCVLLLLCCARTHCVDQIVCLTFVVRDLVESSKHIVRKRSREVGIETKGGSLGSGVRHDISN